MTFKNKIVNHPFFYGLIFVLLSSVMFLFGAVLVCAPFAFLDIAEGVGIISIWAIFFSASIIFLFSFVFRNEFKIKLSFSDNGDRRFSQHMVVALVISFMPTLFGFYYYGLNTSLNYFFLSIVAGTAEEIIFRFIPITIFMASEKSKDKKIVIMFLTAFVFSLAHFSNYILGTDLKNTLLQMIFSFGLGALFAAIYMSTGNIFYTIIFHVIYDFAVLSTIPNVTGIIVFAPEQLNSVSLISFVYQGVFAFIYIFIALKMIRFSNLELINNMWSKIWFRPLVKNDIPLDKVDFLMEGACSSYLES